MKEFPKYGVDVFYSIFFVFITASFIHGQIASTFNYNIEGQRVCLVDAIVTNEGLQLNFLDASLNDQDVTAVYRRNIYGNGSDWVLQVSGLPAGTISWTDSNVQEGDLWEYQIRRTQASGDALGYVAGSYYFDQSDYRGQMILAISDDLIETLPDHINRLKKDLTADGWFVNELIISNGGNSFDYGDQVIDVKNAITNIYDSAPTDDKPMVLTILGNVPLPRSGQGLQPPDGHIEASGARGSDVYYADIDGLFSDIATYDVPEQNDPILKNYPGDFKWDQDVIPSELEMAFGRINFHRSVDGNVLAEEQAMRQYLDRLHDFRYVTSGTKLGTRSAFYANGYSNSTDASYRSLPALSGGSDIMDSGISNESGHCEWVKNNGPFLWYMQNQFVPQLTEWETHGMDALVYSSDQSYWGYGDLPNNGSNSGWSSAAIRRILSYDNSNCLIALWTTSAINVFHQAGVGEPLGYACKQIMDHNEQNQKLEKVHQEWDTPEWWNRTHFNFFGDPTLRLYQTFPPSDLALGTEAPLSLEWTPSIDPNIIGYHVYKSDSELGKYVKLTLDPITDTNYNDPSFIEGEWYMVRAVANQTTGSGIFLNPSHGIFVEGRTIVSAEDVIMNFKVSIFPNPTSDYVRVTSDVIPERIEIVDVLGKTILQKNDGLQFSTEINVSDLPASNYFIKIFTEAGVAVKSLITN